MRTPNTIAYAKGWLIVCVFLNCSGWLLSALGHLDAAGYVAAVALGVIALLLWARKASEITNGFSRGFRNCGVVVKLRWRARYLLPTAFGLLFLCSFLGGVMYPPNNYDALTYRIPRALHWLAAHQWHWIETGNGRMNFSGTGFEWLMAPLLALTRSDRLFFLINVVSYALLPGLAYAVLIRLGVNKRLAWYWMWLIPSAYCFALQAGSVGNDSFSTIFLLSALYFALRARETGRISDVWYGMLSVALMTGTKVSNLPLVLPWLAAARPTLSLLPRRWFATAGIVAVCSLISFLPIATLNAKHTGSWSGDPDNKVKVNVDPVFGLIGNTMQTACINLLPPILPMARSWNEAVRALIETEKFRPLVQHFPRFSLARNELEQEEGAGMGLGISVLLAATLMSGVRGRRIEKCGRTQNALSPESRCSLSRQTRHHGLQICAAAAVAALAFMAKVGSESSPRLLAPYYVLVIAGILLLAPGAPLVFRKNWWRTLAGLVALTALPITILTPSRPLWPAVMVFDKLASSFRDNALFQRGRTVYSIYRQRSDCLAPLRKYLPVSTKTIAFVGQDDPETSLWRPFGARTVQGLTAFNEARITGQKIVVCASEESVRVEFGRDVKQWITDTHGRVLGQEKLMTRASGSFQEWYVIGFDVGSR
ncbi:MAG: hypothetical protein WCP06_13385 [Verrucomicrobiota bacterium]